MSDNAGWTRRQVIATGAAVAAGGVLLADSPAQAAPSTKGWSSSSSQNGWPVADAKKTAVARIEGSDAQVTLLAGAASTVLLYVARRFHYEVHPLAPGDVHGYRTSHAVGAPFESNYLSGTAIEIAPNLYPLGSAGNFFPLQLLTIRDILAECGGVVRWGGDDRTSPKEGHFQIDVRAGDIRLTDFAQRLTGWARVPGRGAGATPDLLDPARRSAATALQRRQQAG